MKLKELKKIEGLVLLECYKLFLEEERENIPYDLRNQEADGLVYLVFSNNIVIGFFHDTEHFSLNIKRIKKSEIPKDAKNISSSPCISNIINTVIRRVNIAFAYNSIRINSVSFSNNHYVLKIIYLQESQFTFDVLVLRCNKDNEL